MIRVRAPSRLHFGLLSLGSADYWPNRRGDLVLPARRFGSVGLMIESPGVTVTAQPANEWSAEGPMAERALKFAKHVHRSLPKSAAHPQQIVVRRVPSSHAGLGTGTQLALSVARAVTASAEMPGLSAAELARRAGRGLRSALGLHGFEHGGFLVEGGKRDTDPIAPMLARAEFPVQWRVVLMIPPWGKGLHGTEEARAFDQLGDPSRSLRLTDSLCRLVLLGMLPALAECDLRAFGEALYDFNLRAGEAFANVQGGFYSNPRIAEAVELIRSEGIYGAGQSSWGPAVFAIAEDHEEAHALAEKLRSRFSLTADQILVTAACNTGAVIETVA
jgi:beta-ribofuranosylaminobenzene 5'-phosphate synthase